MIVVQISDLHVTAPGDLAYGRIDPTLLLRRAVEHLNSLSPQPDLIVATGDLTDKGSPKEYAELRAIIDEVRAPVYLCPGNHDDREALLTEFAHHEYLKSESGFIQYTIEGFPVRLISLDSTTPGQDGGALCEVRRSWLDTRLREAPTAPTILYMHHPPFATGIDAMDAIGLADSDEFSELVAAHPNVLGIWCGHLHRPITCRWAGTVVTTCPSTAHQVGLDLRSTAPLSFVMEQPGYQIHLFNNVGKDIEVVTHTAVIPDGELSFLPTTMR